VGTTGHALRSIEGAVAAFAHPKPGGAGTKKDACRRQPPRLCGQIFWMIRRFTSGRVFRKLRVLSINPYMAKP
jgi:hypothetical protein